MPIDPATYTGYRGLPPLVGLHSMDEATRVGLTVDQSVDRLKRIHWSLRRLHGIFVARLTAMPVYELKMAFALHAHYCAEHVAVIRERVREMRQPPYGLDAAPDEALETFFDEIQNAPAVGPLVYGLYAKAVPAVLDAMKALLTDVNRLFDFPTHRVCKLAKVEVEEVADYGRQACEALLDADARQQVADWGGTLDKLLAAAGGLDGTQPAARAAPPRVHSARPFVYDARPQRDERFIDPYNMGVNAEAMLFDPNVAPRPKTLMLYFKRLREIDVPEMMASIITQTPGKPWAYSRDMTRQLWDEARHAMMGEVGFVSLGIDWTQIPINFTWSLNLNTKLSPLDRHAVLFFIEQGLMPKKTGKEYEWEVAVATADRLTQLIQDFDWADEILHARIGRDWLVPEFGSQQKVQEAGNAAWNVVQTDFDAWWDDGLTEHRNWWPEVYRQACERWGVEPSPELLAYAQTYAGVRADQKAVVLQEQS